MNALDVLRQQHRQIRECLQMADATQNKDDVQRRQLQARITEDLHLHERLEERFFYPELKRHEATEKLARRAYDEHQLAEIRLKELGRMHVREDAWKTKLTQLKKTLEAHIAREEDEMFTAARLEMGEERLELMGEEMLRLAGPPKEHAA